MYNFPIDKELFQDTLGLSCVENLLIYALRSANLAYPCLFYHSHLSLPEIIHEFTVNRSSYAAFCAVERIQNLAVQNGLLEMELLELKLAAVFHLGQINYQDHLMYHS